ncbi:MAG: AMP-binding protein [Bacillota bacterium]|nr:long-chain fatty acid--CoA ligase [Bacillota bacterium]
MAWREGGDGMAADTAGRNRQPAFHWRTTAPRLFFRQAERLGDRVALRHKVLGLWTPVTWRQYAEHVRRLANGLLALGAAKGDRIALIGENRPEWLYADLAIQACGAVSTGIYATNSPEQCLYVLSHAEARFFFVENEEQLDKFLEIEAHVPHVQRVIVMDTEGLRGFRHPKLMSLKELAALGDEHAARFPRALDERIDQIDPGDVALLIYTSGTTGPPKGAMLTHLNVLWTADSLGRANVIRPDEETLSFLPLSHIAQRMVSVYLPLYWGYTVNFCENTDTVLQDMREISPTLLFAVPRIWEKIHSRIELQVQETDWVKRTAYRLAVGAGRRYSSAVERHGRAPLPLRAAYALARLAVLHPLTRRVGLDRVRFAISGAAPISPDVLRYFLSLGVPIREVYGQTEGSGPTTIHQGGRIKPGTVGQPLPGVEVRIADDGEILVRGPNVFKGYYKDPEATARTLVDGWLHSGDVGELDEEGFLRVTDRKKDLFITAGGKNIAPQYIENKLKFSPYIHDAVVVGDGRRYIAALIVIDEENVGQWAQAHKIPYTTYTDLTRNEQVRQLIAAEVAKVNKTLSSPEQVKRFAILPVRLHQEDGDVTPTLKVKRQAVMARFADLVAELYDERGTPARTAAGHSAPSGPAQAIPS